MAIDMGLTDADSVVGRVIVPACLTGGRRYHVMNYQDDLLCIWISILSYLMVVVNSDCKL